MRFQKQAFRHKPEEGIYGDCHRTVLACLLDMDRDDVPNFGKDYLDNAKFQNEVNAWVHSQGFQQTNFAFNVDLQKVFTMMGNIFHNTYYILGGNSKNGVGHSVICCADQIVWDTSLDDSGIVGPMDDDLYWVTILTPVRFTCKQEDLKDWLPKPEWKCEAGTDRGVQA